MFKFLWSVINIKILHQYNKKKNSTLVVFNVVIFFALDDLHKKYFD